MKRILFAAATLTALLFTNTIFAQDSTDSTTKKKKTMSLSISNKGITFEEANDTAKSKKPVKTDKEKVGKPHLTFAMFDLGFNMLNDATNYSDPTLATYLNVPAADRKADLFDLKNGKSMNVNIYPLMVKLPIVKTKNQRLYLATGLGFQVYNFRFDKDISYTKKSGRYHHGYHQFQKEQTGRELPECAADDDRENKVAQRHMAGIWRRRTGRLPRFFMEQTSI